MRALEKASPRVKIFTIGHSEEGRETLLVAVSEEANLRKLDRYREINAKLADPRKTPDSEAKKLIEEDNPDVLGVGQHPFPRNRLARNAHGAGLIAWPSKIPR